MDLAHPDPLTAGVVVRNALQDFRSGHAYGAKAVIEPREQELLALLGHDELDPRFAAERLNWKLNALVSAGPRYCAVKLVGSNAYNRLRQLPRSRSLIVIYEKLGMVPLALFDGTALSARRTGAYASVAVETLLSGRSALKIALFGAGPIAECVVDDLHAHHGERIECISVTSRDPASAERFAAAARQRTGLHVTVFTGRAASREADLIITATNARAPLLARHDVATDAVVLHLGGDELAPDLIAWMLKDGLVVCDDVETVCHRNSQSLPLYFSRAGRTLQEAAAGHHIVNLPSLLAEPGRDRGDGPALVTCVGLPVLDLYMAQWLYEHHASAPYLRVPEPP